VIIKRAKTQGFCFGVAITVKKAEEAVARPGASVTTLGHVVHNPQMVASLEAQGLKNAHSVEEVPDNTTLFVRAHGLPTPVYDRAKEKNLTVIDATCPMVTKIHVQAEKLRNDGYKIVVVGDAEHPEVKGTLSHVPGAWCIASVAEVAKLPRGSKIGVVVQSTWSGTGFTDIVKALSEKYYEVRAVNTICTDTHNRQAEAADLAQDVEVMVVVGGKTSANTKHLAELSAMNGARPSKRWR
jgi:(E)-4-hydroxy-3-methyl-but-2-enyl pyrophosphate reductase